MIYFKELNLSINSVTEKLKKFISFNPYYAKSFWNNLNTEKIVTEIPELQNIFDTLNITVKKISIISTSLTVGDIHVDDLNTSPIARINLPIFNCDTSITNFYSTKSKPIVSKLKNNVYYMKFNAQDCNLVSTFTLRKATVIRPREPHQVCVYGKTPRISCTIEFKENIENLLEN